MNYMNCFQAILKQNCTFCSSFGNYLSSGAGKKKQKNEKRPSMAFDHILRSSSVGAVCSGVAMAQFAISLLLSHIAFALSCLREEDVVTPSKASEWTLSKEFVFEVYPIAIHLT